MPIHSRYRQDPDYEPVDLFELGEEEDQQYYEEQRYIAEAPQRNLSRAIRARKAQYLEYRQKNHLTHAQAVFAVDPDELYYKMPAAKKVYAKKAGAAKVTKKTYPKKTPGTGLPKKTYAAVDVDKRIQAGINKAMSKNIETQHSFMDVIMRPGTNGLAGKIIAPLNKAQVVDTQGNKTGNYTFNNNSTMVLNLSSMMQVRGASATSASGWRSGFKTNVLSIKVDIRGVVKNCTVECKYHAMLVRKKDGVRPAYYNPTLINFDESQLWRKNNAGPFGHENFHYDYPTLDKKNTEVWSWPTGGHVEKSVAPVNAEGLTRTFQLSMYKEIGAEWEFNTDLARADPALKGGDYCLFIFREGPDDLNAIDSTIRAVVDISFKDTQ